MLDLNEAKKIFFYAKLQAIGTLLVGACLAVSTLLLVLDFRAERKFHEQAMKEASRILERKDEQLALREQHVEYLEKYLNGFHKSNWGRKK